MSYVLLQDRCWRLLDLIRSVRVHKLAKLIWAVLFGVGNCICCAVYGKAGLTCRRVGLGGVSRRSRPAVAAEASVGPALPASFQQVPDEAVGRRARLQHCSPHPRPLMRLLCREQRCASAGHQHTMTALSGAACLPKCICMQAQQASLGKQKGSGCCDWTYNR